MLEKDARCSGYCFGDCVGVALKISEKRGGGRASLYSSVIYDYSLDGKWEKAKDESSDFSIYRMHRGMLEIHRSGVRARVDKPVLSQTDSSITICFKRSDNG
ncbi:MAG: hypothetical protein ACL7BU_02350 [Candidatus Phlomobacter fragariae]